MRHFFLPVTVCALALCAGRKHTKAMRERIDGEVQKRWCRSAALVSAAADGDEDRVRVYSTRWVVVFSYFLFLLLLFVDCFVVVVVEE